MEISSKDEFGAKLQAFLDTGKESDSTADFAKYFEETYAHRPEMWAYCHSLGYKVHHNMHLEAMHRVIKHEHICMVVKSKGWTKTFMHY